MLLTHSETGLPFPGCTPGPCRGVSSTLTGGKGIVGPLLGCCKAPQIMMPGAERGMPAVCCSALMAGRSQRRCLQGLHIKFVFCASRCFHFKVSASESGESFLDPAGVSMVTAERGLKERGARSTFPQVSLSDSFFPIFFNRDCG